MATYSPDSLGINAKTTGGKFQQGAYYDSRQYWNGTLSEPGQIHPESNQQGAGQAVSAETIRQSSPVNQPYIEAARLQAPVGVPYTSSNQGSFFNSLQSNVDSARGAISTRLSTDQGNNQVKMDEARKREQGALDEVKKLTTPFREDIAKKYQPTIDKQFDDQIALTDQLQTLLQEGQNLIQQQQRVTGLDAVRNPRIQKSMNDVTAQAGIIQAVLAQKTTNIATAYTIIDKTVGYIAQDRQDQLSYYSTILNLANRDILSLDAESKTIANEQIGLLKNDLVRAQDTADYVKKLMVNPDSALLMAKAGVTLNDSPEVISQKMAQAQITMQVQESANEITKQGGTLVNTPAGINPKLLRSFTDANGQTHYYKMPDPAARVNPVTGDQNTDNLFTLLGNQALGGKGLQLDTIGQASPSSGGPKTPVALSKSWETAILSLIAPSKGK